MDFFKTAEQILEGLNRIQGRMRKEAHYSMYNKTATKIKNKMTDGKEKPQRPDYSKTVEALKKAYKW